MRILVRDIRIPFYEDAEYAFDKAKKKLKPLGAKVTGCYVFRRSLDCRRRDNILYVYTVCAEVTGSYTPERLQRVGAIPLKEDELEFTYGDEHAEGRPVVVGFGPCGMFCALLLAEHGYRPIVLERGGNTAERKLAVDAFTNGGILNTECNIQFGAGGAGTFSDGKLMTRINDEYCHYVLSRFRDFGAPEDIMVNAKPHIGTDLLPNIVDGISRRITELGGEVHYNTKFIGVSADGIGRIKTVKTTRGDFSCSALVLAIGHSARDTYGVLREGQVELTPKSFSVGVRIEHLQADIDASLYGEHVGHPALPVGEYGLSAKLGERGVYSFCMCPGGTVATAASEVGGVVTNGMSEYARDGVNANSALAVSVFPQDFGGTVDGAVEFIRKIESRAYKAGGGDYFAPVQTVGDFLAGKRGTDPQRVAPTYGGGRVRTADLNEVLPHFVCETLRYGITDFARKLSAFKGEDAILTGAETRTSSPIRIPRLPDGTAASYGNLYPCGEGAGYAGGITSAAVDGVRCAITLMKRYIRTDEK